MFKGSMPALVTPFKDGAVDFETLKSLVDWQIAAGSHGLVPVGTTGETPTLSHEEHRDVVRICVETAAGRIPGIAGAGSNNTVEAVDLAIHAEQAGADSILAVTPYYNKPTQEGLYLHFKRIAEAVDMIIVPLSYQSDSELELTVKNLNTLIEVNSNIILVINNTDTADAKRIRTALKFNPQFKKIKVLEINHSKYIRRLANDNQTVFEVAEANKGDATRLNKTIIPQFKELFSTLNITI